jgi:heterodisulfide reductase subunit A
MSERIGVYICECGPNIAERVDIDEVITEVSRNGKVKVAKRYKLLCSGDGKEFLKQEIHDQELTRLVVAACSPREHETTFMQVCEEAGLNPYLFQLVNIREHCAWIVPDKEAATQRAIKLVKAGLARVERQRPLDKVELEACSDVLVIGGGIAGIQASLSLAGKDRTVYLVERGPSLGGVSGELSESLPSRDSVLSVVRRKAEEVENDDSIQVLTSSEVLQALGFFGNFEVRVRTDGDTPVYRDLTVGAVVVATGFEPFDPRPVERYGYGNEQDVYTALEIERMCSPDSPTKGQILLRNGNPPRSVAIIHCVGRKEVGYCSRLCCLSSLKLAQYLVDTVPDIQVTEVYSDLCLPGRHDQAFFEQTQGKGVDFVRGKKVKVGHGDGGIRVGYEGTDGSRSELTVDMVVLSTGVVPRGDAGQLAEMLNIPRDTTGFFRENHVKLDPVSTPMEGICIVGCAQGPKDMLDSMVQAEAAAGKVRARLVPGRKLEPEVKVSEISEALCTGCQTCLSVCFYGAISYDEIKGISVVNGAICRGCGNCAGSCPSGAARLKHFTSPQLHVEVMEALG